jgi:hypothetical protein
MWIETTDPCHMVAMLGEGPPRIKFPGMLHSSHLQHEKASQEEVPRRGRI